MEVLVGGMERRVMRGERERERHGETDIERGKKYN